MADLSRIGDVRLGGTVRGKVAMTGSNAWGRQPCLVLNVLRTIPSALGSQVSGRSAVNVSAELRDDPGGDRGAGRELLRRRAGPEWFLISPMCSSSTGLPVAAGHGERGMYSRVVGLDGVICLWCGTGSHAAVIWSGRGGGQGAPRC